MKKWTALALALTLAALLAACTPQTTDTVSPTETPGNTATDTPTETPTDTPTTSAPTGFQDLSSLQLTRLVVEATQEKASFVYNYADSYNGKTITNVCIEKMTIFGEEVEYTIVNEKTDAITQLVGNSDYIAFFTVNSTFEDGEMYQCIINLTVTYEDGSTASITDLFSYECELT